MAYALTFDGANDYVTVNPSLSISSFTVSFLLKWDDLGTDSVQFICESATRGQFMCHLGGGAGNNGIRFSLSYISAANTLDVTGIIEAGINRYTITYDGTTVKMYRNGVLISSKAVSWPTVPVSTLYLGAREKSRYFLDGDLMDFRVFNYALTENELNAIKNSVLAGNEAGLILYYKMDEGSGTTLNDTSPSGKNGTISGAVWTNIISSVSGIVTDANGDPAARTVRVYDRNTGALIISGVSNATTGEYNLATGVVSEVLIVGLSPNADENALVRDRVVPN